MVHLDRASGRDYVRQVFEGQGEIALENLARIHARVGDRFDAVMTCGTDFGTQTGAFCSVDTFRDLWRRTTAR